MTPPQFSFQPWEMCLLSPGDSQVVTATKRALIRRGALVSAYLIEDDLPPLNPCNPFSLYAAHPFWAKQQRDGAPVLLIPNKDWDASPRALKRALTQNLWERYIGFDEHLRLADHPEKCVHRLKIEGSTNLYWFSLQGRTAPFELKADLIPSTWNASWCEKADAKEWEQIIQKACFDAESDCSFSLRYASLSYEEQDDLLFESPCGGLKELRRIVQCIMICDDRVQSSREPLTFSTWDSTSYSEREFHLDRRFFLMNDRHFMMKSNQFALLELLKRFFRFRSAEFPQGYSALRRDHDIHFNVVVHPPTQHERLEARLQLRDWLRGKVSPEEIPFLLGEA